MKFTVITPSLNQGRFIEQTINSVVSQHGEFEIEYLVLDGGSSDDTVEILKKFEKRLKSNIRISFKWKSNKDGGQADALNKGIKLSSGDIWCFINSDDYYLPNTFQIVADYFKNNQKAMWLVGNCKVSDTKLGWTFWLKHWWPIQYFKQALLIFNTVNQPAVFLKKDLVDKVGLFNTPYHYAFDYDYWLRCAKYCLPNRIYKDLSVFRIHQNAKGNTNFLAQFDEDLRIVKKYTNNPIILAIHKLGQAIVKVSYTLLK